MENLGEQFLHQKDRQLHTTQPIEHEQEQKKLKNESTTQKPAEKIADWFKIIEQTHLGHRDDPQVLERIKDYYHKKHVIKSKDIPESYFDQQRQLAREQGHGDIEITDEMKKQAAEVIIADQKSTLDNWVDYFISPDSDSFPMWAKYWTFEGMLKLSTYDKEKHIFRKRDKGTVAPFSDLNREALAYVMNALIEKIDKGNIITETENLEFKKLLQEANFGKLYAWAIEKITPAEKNELLITEGQWVKYEKYSDSTSLIQSLEGYGTGWCTAGLHTAQLQLQGGDFYVYYSYDKEDKPIIPRIAIRMQDTSVAEIRGIAYEQNFDPIIANTDILDKKLQEFGQKGQKYQKKSTDMKRLTQIEKKWQHQEELSQQDSRFLYEIDTEIEGFGWQKDPRIEEIKKGRNIKKDLSLITGFAEHEISITSSEALGGNIKYHYGDLDLSNLASAEGLELPESIGGDLDLGSLTSAKGLKLPESIGHRLDLRSLTSVEGLKLPESIGGDLDLSRLVSAKGLKLPKSIGGDLYLSSLVPAKGLELPKSIGGYLDLGRLVSAKGLELPKSIGGNLYLGSLTSVEGLKLPESIGGDLDLRSLTSVEGLKLPESIGGYLNLGRLVSAKGLELPKSIGGYLDLGKLVSAKGLELPKSIGGNLYLRSLTSAEGLKLPESIGHRLDLSSLTSAEKHQLENQNPRLLII